uniref:Uncharacterized protein n=1 Tax=Onchocerca volvulus TaxID=6282 RepID=A0A2K6WLM4_ONCVO
MLLASSQQKLKELNGDNLNVSLSDNDNNSEDGYVSDDSDIDDGDINYYTTTLYLQNTSWDDTSAFERYILTQLLAEGRINNTMLPWISGRRLVIRIVRNTEAATPDNIISVTVFQEI